jgi:hypothetical protein
VLHTMDHADEVRNFQQVPKGEKVQVSEKEVELGLGLIDRLVCEEFHQRITRTIPHPRAGDAGLGRAKQRGDHCSAGTATWRQGRRHHRSA